AIKEEKYAARRAILPMLQAEEDERQVITSPDLLRFDHFDPVTVMHGLPWVMICERWQKYLEEEARIMKDVPGWKVGESVYHSGKWMSPVTGEMRPDVWIPTSSKQQLNHQEGLPIGETTTVTHNLIGKPANSGALSSL
nr:hypothetical protein [Tanacetum cinerariifolium]